MEDKKWTVHIMKNHHYLYNHQRVTYGYRIFVKPDPDSSAFVAAFDIIASYCGSSVVRRRRPLQLDVVDVAVTDDWRSRGSRCNCPQLVEVNASFML